MWDLCHYHSLPGTAPFMTWPWNDFPEDEVRCDKNDRSPFTLKGISQTCFSIADLDQVQFACETKIGAY